MKMDKMTNKSAKCILQINSQCPSLTNNFTQAAHNMNSQSRTKLGLFLCLPY